MAASTNMHVASGFARLFNTEAFSDCKVICGPYEFNLHKAILSAQSDYFATAFKSGTFKEGQSGVIELKARNDDKEQFDDSCDDPEIFKLMIEYFYHFDYLRKLDPAPSSDAPKTFLVEHAKVVAMAVKYQADGLRKHAAQKFKGPAEKHWQLDDFVQAISIVHLSAPDDASEFWDVVSDVIHANFDILNSNEEVKAVMRNVASLAFGLMERSRIASVVRCSNVSGHKITFACGGCGTRNHFCKVCYGSHKPHTACQSCGNWI